MIVKALILFALCNVVVQAHICMWAPLQRQGYSIETPGESLCYLKVGPCGGVASAEPQTTLVGGKPFTIAFQQNLNHFYIQNPGKLVADFANTADPTEEDFSPLATVGDYNAMNEITQTNFTMRVQVPNVATDHGVVRLRYLSNNPTENDRGMIFYQCADVKVTASSSVEVEQVVPEVPAASFKGYECCAPKQFTIDGYESSSWRNPTNKKFYFDAVNKLFRVDTNSGKGVTVKDGYFQMFNNFTSGIEYYHNVNAGTCDLYGLNYWADWCYGSVNAQTLHASSTVGYLTTHIWEQKDTPFLWTNIESGCVPYSMGRIDTGEKTIFSNMKVQAPDASVFQLPAACVRAEAALKSIKDLQKAPEHHNVLPAVTSAAAGMK
jgi:hypothetical protein